MVRAAFACQRGGRLFLRVDSISCRSFRFCREPIEVSGNRIRRNEAPHADVHLHEIASGDQAIEGRPRDAAQLPPSGVNREQQLGWMILVNRCVSTHIHTLTSSTTVLPEQRTRECRSSTAVLVDRSTRDDYCDTPRQAHQWATMISAGPLDHTPTRSSLCDQHHNPRRLDSPSTAARAVSSVTCA